MWLKDGPLGECEFVDLVFMGCLLDLRRPLVLDMLLHPERPMAGTIRGEILSAHGGMR